MSARISEADEQRKVVNRIIFEYAPGHEWWCAGFGMPERGTLMVPGNVPPGTHEAVQDGAAMRMRIEASRVWRIPRGFER